MAILIRDHACLSPQCHLHLRPVLQKLSEINSLAFLPISITELQFSFLQFAIQWSSIGELLWPAAVAVVVAAV